MKHFTKNIRLLLLLLGAIICADLFEPAEALAQGSILKGRVIDDNDQPLPGVNVVEKGTTNGTVTDATGNYSLPINDASGTIVFTFIGYSPQEIKVNGQTTIDVKLLSDITTLNEVMVIGYGAQQKSSIPGAVSTIPKNELARSPAPSVTNSLVGRATGIIAVQRSGEPGNDASTIFIRGLGTTGDAGPIYVIDGIVSDFSNFAQINPAEIENIIVLKDASSAAVFGVRGGNGIIQVTTKRGTTDKAQFSYSFNYGIQNRTRTVERVDSYDHARLYNEALANEGAAPFYSESDIEKFRSGSDPENFPNTDWNSVMYRKNAPIVQHNLSMLGGSDKIRYAMVFGYLDQEGIFITGNNDFKRYNFRSNIDADVTKTTQVSFDITGRSEIRNAPYEDVGKIYEELLSAPPVYVARYENGYLGSPANGNPLLSILPEEGYRKGTDYNLSARVQVLQKLPFVKGLSAKGIFAVNKAIGQSKAWNSPTFSTYGLLPDGTYEERTAPGKASLSQGTTDAKQVTLEAHLNYDNRFGKHAINALALYTQTESDYNELGANRVEYLLRIDELNFGPDQDKGNYGISGASGRIGVVGRLNYTYDDRLTLEGSFRADASEQFAKGNRWGYFPALSASWLVSNENFMKSVAAFDHLKLRTSYGILGNDRLGDERFLYLPSYFSGGAAVLGNNQVNQVIFEGRTANPDVTWEKIKKFNVGIDAGFFKNMLGVNLDVFYDKREDILGRRSASLPAILGVDLPVENFAKVDNKGIELGISYIRTVNQNFNYSIRGNLTYVKNEIVDIDEPASTNPNIKQTGRSLNTKFGYRAIGFFQSDAEIASAANQGTVKPGDIRYEDINKDNVIDENDRVDIGSSNIPGLIYGLSASATFKGFEFSFLLQGAGMVDQYYDFEIVWPFWQGGGASKESLDRWTPSNPGASQPRILISDNQNRLTSSFWMKDASYLKLRNVELAYNFNSSLLNKAGIRSLRCYVNANNVFTITKIEDVDPENGNSRAWAYPQLLIVNFGMGINF